MKAVITADDGELIVRTPYSERAKDALKAVDGRRWCMDRKAWVYPATSASAATLGDVVEYLGMELEGDATFDRLLKQWDRGAAVLSEVVPLVPIDEQCKTKCFDHQTLGYRLIEVRDGVYLAWDMGVGKSKTVVDAVCLLGLRRTLIACPPNVMSVWPGQFADHGSSDVRIVVLDCKLSVERRAALLVDVFDNEPRPVVFVANYQAVWLPPLGPTLKKTDTKRKKRIILESGEILRRRWDLVVADEAHWIKGEQSSVSWFFGHLCKRTTRRVALSGTPTGNGPLDLWAQMRFVDPGLFGTSFVTFRSRYALMGGFQGRQVLGFRNVEVLNKKFYMVAHRVERHDVLDLPPVMHEKIEVELGPEARKLYDEMAASFVTRVGDGTITTSNILTELLRLQQLTGGAVGTDQGDVVVVDHAKENAVEELLSSLPPDEPAIVFGRYVHDVETPCALASKLGRGAFRLRGGCNQRDEWAADDGGSILAVQIDSGGEGIDLTRSRYCIYWSVGFSLLKYEQSLARTDRLGQTRPGIFYHIIARNTVDVKVYASLRAKKQVSDAILDDVVAGGIEALHGGRMG